MKQNKQQNSPFAFALLLSTCLMGTLHAQTTLKIGDPVEVTNIGKGVIVGEYQKTEWNYGTYQVHMDGEKYCNNHVLDTRYNEIHLKLLKKANTQPLELEPVTVAKKESVETKKAAGEFAVGERVLYSQTSVWAEGVIKDYDPVNRRYTLQDVYVGIPCYAVARPAKTYNNDFFIGRWDVHLSSALYTTEKDGKLYDHMSGGMRLFSLLIKKDRTYTWKISAKKVLSGQWKPRENAPGIMILNGIDGKDWTVYETTEGFATNKGTKDEIRFHHQPTNTGYYLATRIGPNQSCVLTGRTF